MAANEYYNNPSTLETIGRRTATPQSDSPLDAYNAYNSEPPSSTSPHISSPHEDYSYHPYHRSQESTPAPYYTSGEGGRETGSPFADDIPLRQHPSKGSPDVAVQDRFPEDPAIIDRQGRSRSTRRPVSSFFSGKVPWVVYTLTLIQSIVFIAELVKNGVLTGSPIEIHPQFNPMIGPSPYVLINMGARYVPCMRSTPQGLDSTITWPCPNSTSASPSDPGNSCRLNNLCGFHDGPYSPDKLPNQWFRFIVPMFLHAGFIHIGFNMLLQLLMGREMEILIGPVRFVIVYLSSGIFGFVLGGNFAAEGIASTGASGALFGIIALFLLDLLYHWGERTKPWSDLAWILLDIGISFVLGLLPGLDNFSHVGGFSVGLVLGVCLLHSPDVLRQRVGEDLPPYASVRQARNYEAQGFATFFKEPVGFFKGRKPLWWAWWLVRAAALVGVIVSFIVLLENFRAANPSKCSWCKYVSCLPIKNWCDIGNLQTTNTTSKARRGLLSGPGPVALDGFF